MCGRQLPAQAPVPTQAPAAQPVSPRYNRHRMQSVGAISARPVGDFLNKLGEGIFVGAFRGTRSLRLIARDAKLASQRLSNRSSLRLSRKAGGTREYPWCHSLSRH